MLNAKGWKIIMPTRHELKTWCEDALGRDGCYDDDAVFLIFEKDDLIALKQHVETAISISG